MELFKKDINEFQIELSDKQISQFQFYYELLIEWNSFMNLTAITDFSEVLKKHFVDSVSLIKAVPDLKANNYSLIDVGTGAGFPGIPLPLWVQSGYSLLPGRRSDPFAAHHRS